MVHNHYASAMHNVKCISPIGGWNKEGFAHHSNAKAMPVLGVGVDASYQNLKGAPNLTCIGVTLA